MEVLPQNASCLFGFINLHASALHIMEKPTFLLSRGWGWKEGGAVAGISLSISVAHPEDEGKGNGRLWEEREIKSLFLPTNMPPKGLREGPRRVTRLRTLNLLPHLLQELFLPQVYISQLQSSNPMQPYWLIEDRA